MSITRKLYLSILGRPISFLQNAYAVFTRPFMVYGYKSKFDGNFYKFIRISSTAVITNHSKLELANHVWIGHYNIIDASNGVVIGKGCQLAAWVGVFSHSSHNSIRLLGERYIHVPAEARVGYERGKIEIGEYTFIGSHALILPGVTIGKGCLIGAGTVINRSIPDYTIAVGNPFQIKGKTTELDKLYFKEKLVQDSYFDRELIEAYLANLK